MFERKKSEGRRGCIGRRAKERKKTLQKIVSEKNGENLNI